MKEILFKGKKYITDIENFEDSGFISTKHQYQNGLCSYAYYYPEGISRFGKKIGDRSDIKILGDIKIEPTDESFDNIFSSKT